MKNGIISLGEALIDFIPMDDQNNHYQKSPGGAPANVAVGLARLGAKATFLGKVGDDVLGRFLKETLQRYGVDVTSMLFTREIRTGVVFVTLDSDGDRSFDFYIDPSADRFLEEKEVPEELFQNHHILHFGSISMIGEPARSATRKAVRLAKENGMTVSYDPNLRHHLWKSEEEARSTIISMLPEADVLKISEEELAFITGYTTIEQGIEAMRCYDIPLIFLTLGSEGSIIITRNETATVPAIKVDAVDTTGAGDAYVSGILYRLNKSEKAVTELTAAEAADMAKFASISGALAASTKGAMTALPTLEQMKGKHGDGSPASFSTKSGE